MTALTASEVEHIASEAAKKAVSEFLVSMGVDATEPGALLEMQKDFAHIRNLRKSVETVRKQTLMVSVGVVVSGLLGLIYMAFQRGGH